MLLNAYSLFKMLRNAAKCWKCWLNAAKFFPDVGVLEENGLGNIKKELKIKRLVKGNRQAGLLEDTTTSV